MTSDILDVHSPGAVPPTLVQHFQFSEDDRTGDLRRFHLYLYFQCADPGGSHGKFHTQWSISRTEEAVAGSGASDLVDDRRRINEALFRREIIERLREEKACLIERGGRLMRVPAMQGGAGSPTA